MWKLRGKGMRTGLIFCSITIGSLLGGCGGAATTTTASDGARDDGGGGRAGDGGPGDGGEDLSGTAGATGGARAPDAGATDGGLPDVASSGDGPADAHGGQGGGGAAGGRSGTGGSSVGGASGRSGTGGFTTDGGGTDVAGGGGRVGAGGGPDAAAATGGATGSRSRDVDLLFMIDDSSSMAPLQAKLTQRLPDFMNVLKGIPGGLPDLHVAVITSSLGAGRFANVPGCMPNTAGNAQGAFHHPAACAALHPGQTFLSSIGGVNNFDGDISDAFSCIAAVGDKGCGFEHQFESTRVALQRAQNPADLDNAGFVRAGALLAVIMLTNEDDCSGPADSDLYDPTQQTLADPYGGLQSYRCNEFGHICNGGPPPHFPGSYSLTGCTSAEDAGRLVTVQGFIDFLKGLTPAPNRILAAALAGPTDTYQIEPKSFQLGTGSTEVQPTMIHSCTQTPLEYADPAVRVRNWTDAFGQNGIFESICAADFGPALNRIANAITRLIGS